MTDKQIIEKNVARYGAVEYEQNNHKDWRKIANLDLFSKAVFISSEKKSDNVMKNEDYDETLRILKETFLNNPVSEQYKIVYCPDEQNPPAADRIFIRLVWIVSRKEPDKLNLVKNFIDLYYFFVLDGDKSDNKNNIANMQEYLAKDWIIQLKSLYEKHARGTHGGTHALAERCHIIENLFANAFKDNSGPFHKKAV